MDDNLCLPSTSSREPISSSTNKMDSEEPVYSMSTDLSPRLDPQLNSIDSAFLHFSARDDNKPANCLPTFLKSRVRYIILTMTMLYLTFTRANELGFNFTIICMLNNSTENNDQPLYMTPKEVSLVFASIGIGAIVSVLPVVLLLQSFGSRYLFSTLLMISAISTALFSPLAKISPILMAPLRLLQGLSLSTVMTIMGEVTAQWAPVTEIGTFMTFLSAASQISLVLTMPLSAFLCVEVGWSSVYYVLGLLSGIVALLFLTFYRNTPDTHPWVTSAELHLITKGEKRANRKNHRVPYREIFKSKPVWAVWVAFLGNSFGFQLIIQYMPLFINKVMQLPVAQTGMAAFIPPCSQLLIKFIAVSICDRIHCISETLKLQIFNSIAMVGCGLSFLPLGFLSPGSYVLATLCFTSSISFLGIVTCGSLKSAALIARQFTSFVMAIVQLVICVGALFLPFLVSSLAPDNTIEQWRYVFFCVCFMLCSTNVVFCIICSAEPQPWTFVTEKPEYQTTSDFTPDLPAQTK